MKPKLTWGVARSSTLKIIKIVLLTFFQGHLFISTPWDNRHRPVQTISGTSLGGGMCYLLFKHA